MKCAKCKKPMGCFPECENPTPSYTSDHTAGDDVPEYLRKVPRKPEVEG